MRNILVVDGNSIINRAFYGIRLLQAQNGKYTNAIYGMVNIIWRVMESLSPAYAAVAFDVKAPTFRHKMYDAYKAGRHATPDELLSQFPDAKEMLSALGLSVLELPGWEADDIQGTVARFAEKDDDVHAYILSGDKDLLQLISPSVTVILAGNKDQEYYDEAKFIEKYGVKPSQFVDVKALMGDHSDNIPGVPGIGEVSALKLIAAFGSLDGIYDALKSESLTKEEEKLLSPSVRRKLTEGKESAYLSQTLARISCEAPIGKTLADLGYAGIQKGALYRKCIELEFSAFLRKFGVSQADAAAEPLNATAYTAQAQALSESMTVAEDDSFFDEPAKESPIASLKNQVKEAKISKTLPQEQILDLLPETFAVSVRENALEFYAPACGAFDIKESDDFSALQPLFDGKKTVVCYDSKALWHFLKKKGVTLGGIPQDVMLSGYVARGGDGKVTLPALALAYLELDANEQTCAPALIWALAEVLNAEVEKAGCAHLLSDMEWPLAMVLAEMEDSGFKLDVAGMEAYGHELKAEADALSKEIHELAGEPFNINSTKQLGEVLFTKLGLTAQKKTKSGYSTDAETLEKLKDAHPIVDAILAYRQVTKLYTTYALGLVAAADERGRIHTDFKQALTATGRLSSAEPNLQNIPVRTKAGEKMRTYFIAEDGNVLVDADYSQIELRLLAELSADEHMTAAFKAGEDIHRQTASKV
ncbi:MAG: DNA polymerase I, partial [Clostridia bacterium]|nr:DNA polymerase I [Clostridia bacterium]